MKQKIDYYCNPNWAFGCQESFSTSRNKSVTKCNRQRNVNYLKYKVLCLLDLNNGDPLNTYTTNGQ